MRHGTPYRLVAEVEDSGIGISETQARHIFDRFTQADAATTKAFGGTGLGLTISSMLAKRMGGGISMVHLGTGPWGPVSGWNCRWRRPGRPQNGLPPHVSGKSPYAAWPCRVLLAEDNQTNRLLIRKYLRGQPVELDRGRERPRCGGDVQRAAAGYHPDGHVDAGSWMASAPRGKSAACPVPQPVIVALTANAFASDQQACLEAGMDHFLAKPVKKAVLLHTLAAILARDAQQRPRASSLNPAASA